MGITECDNMLMLLSVSQKMNEKVGVPHIQDGSGRFWVVLGTEHLRKHCFNRHRHCAQDRERVMPLMIQGFRDAAEEGGTSVTGGQTVVNPWIIIGGVATVVCQPNEFIM